MKPRLLSLSIIGASLLFGAAASHAADAYLEPEQAFRGSAGVVDDKGVQVRIEIAPGYHLYRERIGVEAQGAELGRVDTPRGVVKFDTTFNREVELLHGTAAVRVPVASAAKDFTLRMTYQGCAEEGLCYQPQTSIVAVNVANGKVSGAKWLGDESNVPGAATTTATPTAAPVSAQTAAPVSETSRIQGALQSGNLLTIAGVFLLAGLLLAFTPCVLPMVPILSSVIVGQGQAVSRTRGFALALAYSLGMAVVYTIFGMVAGLLGEGLAAALQNPWVLGAFALLLSAMALSMFDVFQLQMPAFVQARAMEASNRMPGGRYIGVFLMGGMSALIVGPCVAAPLAGALVFISQTRNVAIGGLALFSLAMGMSVPLLLVGLSAGSLLPRAGAWMGHVKTFFGILLLAVALWLVSPVLPNAVLMLLIGAALMVAAVYLRLFDRLTEAPSGRQRFAQGLGLVMAVLGSTQVVGALSGADDPVRPLKHFVRGVDAPSAGGAAPQRAEFKRVRSIAELDAAIADAAATKRPLMLDFYADWCVSCKEMEHLTFSDASVRERMQRGVMLQVDVTANSADDKALLKRFGLFGPPAILFFDGSGREIEAARVIGYQPPKKFEGALTMAGL
jgi:thioredoxin:protein disulfide reductase